MELDTPLVPSTHRLGYAGFGKRLRHLREKRSLSLTRAAARAGISPAHLLNIERGSSIPTLGVAERLAFVLDSSISELLPEPNHQEVQK
jgi:transcriptional regulator with XRE-family HTH domain